MGDEDASSQELVDVWPAGSQEEETACIAKRESSRVFIRQVLQGGQFVEPKTEKSKRAVVIPPMLVEQLKVHQARQAVELDGNEHDLVFPNETGKADGRS